jgi:hypothetical protein
VWADGLKRPSLQRQTYKTNPRETTNTSYEDEPERHSLVAVLEGDVFVGDFWAWGAGGEGVVGVAGLIVVFGVSGACRSSGSSGHAAFAASAKHAEIGGDDFKTGALLAFLVLPLAGLNATFDENQRTLFEILLSDLRLLAPYHNFVPLGALLTLAVSIFIGFIGSHGKIGDGLTCGSVASFWIATEAADENDFVD